MTAPSGRTVAVLGDALVDELRDSGGVREFPGGTALNVAIGLSVLGTRSALFAAVAPDDDGARIRAHLGTFDVPLVASPAPLGTGRAVSERIDGEPRYTFLGAALEARVQFDDASLAAVRASDAVAVTGVPFDDPAQVDDLAAALADAAFVAVDPNPRPARLRDADAFRRGFERIVAGAALVKVGEDDAALLGYGAVENARDVLLAAGAHTVVSTLGAGGARLDTAEVSVTAAIPAYPGAIVDTMGAGDSVLAAMVDQLVRAESWRRWGAADWEAALGQAMLVAAATCRHEGGLLRIPRDPADGPFDRIGT